MAHPGEQPQGEENGEAPENQKAKLQMVTVMVRELRTEKHHPC